MTEEHQLPLPSGVAAGTPQGDSRDQDEEHDEGRTLIHDSEYRPSST